MDHFSLIPLLLGMSTRYKSALTLPVSFSMAVKSCLCGVSASPPAWPAAASPAAHDPHTSSLLSISVSLTWLGGFSISCVPGSLKHLFLLCLKRLCTYSLLCLPTASRDKSEALCRHSSRACWSFPDTIPSSLSLTLYTSFAQVQLNNSWLPRIPCSVPSTGNPFSQTPTAVF